MALHFNEIDLEYWGAGWFGPTGVESPTNILYQIIDVPINNPNSLDEDKGLDDVALGPTGCLEDNNETGNCNSQECCGTSYTESCCCNGYFSDEPSTYVYGMCSPLCCSGAQDPITEKLGWKVISVNASYGGNTGTDYPSTECMPEYTQSSLSEQLQRRAGIIK